MKASLIPAVIVGASAITANGAASKINLEELLQKIQTHFSQNPDPPIKLIATAIDKGKLTLDFGKTEKTIVVIAPAQIYSRDLPRRELTKFLKNTLGKDFQITFEPNKTQ